GISNEEYLELKEQREKYGDDGLKADIDEPEEQLELTHATDEQIKSIVQIVRKQPEWGMGKIVKMLAAEEFGGYKIKESVVRRELIRMKLDTKEKREAFAKRELPTWAVYK
ncbi:MAG: helix-turn-helix domain-containing protein, partial [Spirochaetes bacterium]|nr:helix-turn-helix domain-containing protein [Spirochaetota bacterium]